MKYYKTTILISLLFIFLLTTNVFAITKESPNNPPTFLKILKEKSIEKEINKPHILKKPKHSLSLTMRDNFSGVILSIDGGNVYISIKENKETETKTIVLDEKTQINKDLNKIKVTDLKVGDNIRVNLERLSKDTFRTRSIRVMTENTKKLLKSKVN